VFYVNRVESEGVINHAPSEVSLCARSIFCVLQIISLAFEASATTATPPFPNAFIIGKIQKNPNRMRLIVVIHLSHFLHFVVRQYQ
jgi:hypothetical protein